MTNGGLSRLGFSRFCNPVCIVQDRALAVKVYENNALSIRVSQDANNQVKVVNDAR